MKFSIKVYTKNIFSNQISLFLINIIKKNPKIYINIIKIIFLTFVLVLYNSINFEFSTSWNNNINPIKNPKKLKIPFEFLNVGYFPI